MALTGVGFNLTGYTSSGTRLSAWQLCEAWRQRRAQFTSDFLANQEAAATAFSTAATSQVSGMAEITAKIALARIQSQAAAKSAALTSSLDIVA